MARPRSEYPTELELQILKVLWGAAPLPVREIRVALAAAGRKLAHTSVITTLNTMVGKRYVQRVLEGKAYLFSPRVAREAVCQRMLGDVVERVFDGSTSAVVLSLFERKDVDAEELKELRKLIDRKLKEG